MCEIDINFKFNYIIIIITCAYTTSKFHIAINNDY